MINEMEGTSVESLELGNLPEIGRRVLGRLSATRPALTNKLKTEGKLLGVLYEVSGSLKVMEVELRDEHTSSMGAIPQDPARRDLYLRKLNAVVRRDIDQKIDHWVIHTLSSKGTAL